MVGCAVSRIVIDKNCFPRNIWQRRHQKRHEGFDVISLIERRDDDGQNGRSDRGPAVRGVTIEDGCLGYSRPLAHAYAVYDILCSA